jgi:hypothetical protein
LLQINSGGDQNPLVAPWKRISAEFGIILAAWMWHCKFYLSKHEKFSGNFLTRILFTSMLSMLEQTKEVNFWRHW